MPNLSSNELREKFRNWILQHGKVSHEGFSDDTPLLERGVINSFQMMELLLFLEETTGRRVELEKLKGHELKNLNFLVQSFARE